jgi:hypothetical protein
MSVPLHSEASVLREYWVVIPAFNEAATIREVAIRTIRQIKNVIVVDDGSTDGTAEALVGLPLTVLRNPTNCGKAASLWRGFQQALTAGACGIVTVDGDGQHEPEDIPKLLVEAASHPDYVIIGARHRNQRRAALRRYVANRVADFWISWAAGYAFADSQSGFRIYPSSLLSQVKIEHGKNRSFVFESEVLIEATRSGHRSLAVPIKALRFPHARPSYFRPVLDIARITCMVGWKLISRGMYPLGLYRAFFQQTPSLSSKHHVLEAVIQDRGDQPASLTCGTQGGKTHTTTSDGKAHKSGLNSHRPHDGSVSRIPAIFSHVPEPPCGLQHEASLVPGSLRFQPITPFGTSLPEDRESEHGKVDAP